MPIRLWHIPLILASRYSPVLVRVARAEEGREHPTDNTKGVVLSLSQMDLAHKHPCQLLESLSTNAWMFGKARPVTEHLQYQRASPARELCGVHATPSCGGRESRKSPSVTKDLMAEGPDYAKHLRCQAFTRTGHARPTSFLFQTGSEAGEYIPRKEAEPQKNLSGDRLREGE